MKRILLISIVIFLFSLFSRVGAQTITAGPATGYISACAGTASASPNIQQFTVSGSNLTAGITATAPTGFQVSLTAGGGYGNTVTLAQTAGTVANTIVYVQSAAAAPAGNITGNVVLSSTGATSVNVAVAGTVNALPTINAVANQTVLNGAPTTAIDFTGTGSLFNWVNNTPGIGLPASGTGNITSFTAVNTGTAPVVATLTATPVSGGFAYITNAGSGTVSVINSATNTVISTITVGTQPDGISVSPDGTRVYVVNGGSETVSVINTATNSVIATVAVGSIPFGISISPDGANVYVINQGASTISVISTATNTVTGTIPIGPGAEFMSVSPDGSMLYVTNNTSGTVSVISTITNSIVATITVGAGPVGIALSPDGSKLYVTNLSSNSVSVVNTATDAVITTIAVGSPPEAVSVSPDGNLLYVTDGSGVSVISTATNAVITTIPVGTDPVGVSVSADGSQVYVVNDLSGTVSVINTTTNTVTSTITVGANPVSQGNFTTGGVSCSGAPVTFTITVNPPPATIIAGSATGYISACAGTASESPNIQQFTVSGSNLTAGITATAPVGFQVSLAAGSGYGNSVTLAETAGTVPSTIIYVQSAATAPAGNIAGNVVLSSTGATSVNTAVTGTVNALPTVNAVANQTVLNGAATTAINFTGTANTFNWVNDTPGIGLAASGTGNIASFTAINTGSTPVTATITATPISAGYGYIANYGAGTVSVINTSTNAFVSTIPVGVQPVGVSVSPNGSQVYVTNLISGSVSVINTASNSVVATIAGLGLPYGIAVNPNGSMVYVTNSGSNTVSVINAATNTVVATIPVEEMPYGLTVSPDGSWVYVANQASSSISVINTSSNTVAATIAVGVNPIGVSVSPDGRQIYVTNIQSNTISVINTATNAVIATIPVGTNPTGILVSLDGSTVYVSNENSNSVSVISTATNTVISTIPVGLGPWGVSVSSDGSHLYVANGDGTVSVINTTTNTVSGTIGVGTDPISLGNFISAGASCSSTPITFTITVNPPPATITAGPVAGYISACSGTASASPDIQQFTVSGSNLTAGITVTAPTGFRVSLTAGGGYGNSVTLLETAGTVANTVVYVQSAVAAPAGDITGDVVLSSTGATSVDIAVAGTVNALPTVNAVANQTVLNGVATTAINFTGIANTFNWVNNAPSVGLAASGTGNIASFTGVNTGNSPVIATITATPISAGFAYIANLDDGTISVINTTTNTVVNTITVGSGPNGASASPDGSRIYVINSGSNTVSVINTLNNTVIATIEVGNSPSVISISPDGGKVYVTNFYGNSVSVINTITNIVISTISIGGNPTGIAVSPSGGVVYVASQGVNYISVINTATNLIVSTIAVGSTPCDVAVSPDGSRVYVANKFSNTVSVINTISNTVISTISVGSNPVGVSISPDGNQLYVTNSGSNNVSVISTATNAVIATVVVGSAPYGVSIAPNGSTLYVTNSGSNDVSVINTATNAVIATVAVGSAPSPLGNFVTEGVSCVGSSVIFTITVNPSTPTISATGTLSPLTTTYGTASVSTSFSVSGTNMTAGILVTPPPGFEVSTDNVTFSSTITVGAAGIIASTTVYIRLTSTTQVGSYSGNIILSSAGAPNVNVAIPSSTVNPAALTITANNVNKAYGASLTGGPGSTAFTATGLQNSETIGSVIIAYGTGAAANSAAGTYTGSVTASSATGGTFTASNYTITYVPGDIIADAPPTIAIAGGPSPLTTIYGTASVSTSFSLSGIDMTAGVLVTPPPGFEVSTDNVNFSSTVTVGASGTIAPITVYIRLTSSTPVGNYSGNIVLSSTGAADVNVEMPVSTVTPAPLTITADNKNKIVGTANPILTLTYSGFVNNDSPAQLTTQPIVSTTAITTSPPGQYPITVSGATSSNYTFTYVAGILTIIPTIIIPNAFTPNGDGVNDTWDIKYLYLYPNCTVAIFNRWGQNLFSSVGYGVPWDGTYRGAALPTGTYYYIVNLKDGGKVLSGYVAIIR